ncbi:PAAR domain-containing protein [Paraburkholderia sp. J63]|uniref:PAAR domain-containing protein n=1 Tax=Paraburkholderia sp. J63 TaxID=2805434 RepID=UPI002ABE739C|nr:PAAR domain-containing protein [Paraburkholderia sp. J63]
MRVPVIRHGDPTTTGGKVVAFDGTIHDNSKVIARHGNQATCGDCKGLWNIVGMSEGGRVVAIQGDSVLCPCGNNRVIAGPDVGCFLDIETTAPSTTESSATRFHSGIVPYDEQFTLHDAIGRILRDTYYTLRLPSGSLVRGVTDQMGRTERHATEGAQRVRVYLGHREA